tara:strand:+ start:303 stop:611 length:309 start_codon:yes stop_codon:yes gene_type:complete
MKKLFIVFFILILIISTTITKNSTKNIEKKIFETKENLRILNNKYEYVLLDYNYLSSPKKLMEFLSLYFDEELVQIDIKNTKKIFVKDKKLDTNVAESKAND